MEKCHYRRDDISKSSYSSKELGSRAFCKARHFSFLRVLYQIGINFKIDFHRGRNPIASFTVPYAARILVGNQSRRLSCGNRTDTIIKTK